MEVFNVMYDKPIQGCLIWIYEILDECLNETKNNCIENNCRAQIVRLEYSVDKDGAIKKER